MLVKFNHATHKPFLVCLLLHHRTTTLWHRFQFDEVSAKYGTKKSKLSLFFTFLHSIALCQGYLNALARHQRSWVGDEIQIWFSVVGSFGNLPSRRPPFWAVGSVQFAMCILPRMICPFFNIYVFHLCC